MEKKRCTNFTKDEVEVLVGLVEGYKEIVECKKTDSTSNNSKEARWKCIENKFNAVCGTGRTAKMLRSKWDSLKKTIKKEYGECKQSLYKTGCGPPTEIKLSGVGDRVLAIVGVGATGTVSLYDSDFVLEVPAAVECAKNLNQILSDTFIENVENAELPSCSWNSWNPQQLRQPKYKVLQQFDDSCTADNEAAKQRDISIPPETSSSVNDMQFHTPNSLNTKRKRYYKAVDSSKATKNKKWIQYMKN